LLNVVGIYVVGIVHIMISWDCSIVFGSLGRHVRNSRLSLWNLVLWISRSVFLSRLSFDIDRCLRHYPYWIDEEL
jgi:hypothetical protein